ncbi:hypothetical protein [Millisia brevis]|uniref:hypothetical protein n=1 Tax=Millisia brevis TaxID=264148 RepID=UPI0008298B6D|nr:hypothetical protein [Millisia brevis]
MVVVRAWRDSHRIVIRVLVADDGNATNGWVFADIDAACRQIASVLSELIEPEPRSAPSDSDTTGDTGR